jgi:hypothetical protein
MIRGCGIALVALGIVHMAVLGLDAWPYVSGWLRLDLWSLEHWRPLHDQPRAMLTHKVAFWFTLGSGAVPGAILGALIVHMNRLGQQVPEFVGWSLLAWWGMAALIIQPSGFPIGVLVATVLMVGIRRQRRMRAVQST